MRFWSQTPYKKGQWGTMPEEGKGYRRQALLWNNCPRARWQKSLLWQLSQVVVGQNTSTEVLKRQLCWWFSVYHTVAPQDEDPLLCLQLHRPRIISSLHYISVLGQPSTYILNSRSYSHPEPTWKSTLLLPYIKVERNDPWVAGGQPGWREFCYS
jgi:hypothetical protein